MGTRGFALLKPDLLLDHALSTQGHKISCPNGPQPASCTHEGPFPESWFQVNAVFQATHPLALGSAKRPGMGGRRGGVNRAWMCPLSCPYGCTRPHCAGESQEGRKGAEGMDQGPLWALVSAP